MTIGEAKAKYTGIADSYRWTVNNLNATDYNSSLLFQEVDTFNQFIHTDIIDKLDEYADNLRAIKIDEKNYSNTVSKIGQLKTSVSEGRMAIDGYNTSISQKAIEVFNEYNEKFGAFGRLYEGNKKSASKLIELAQEAENKANDPPCITTKDKNGYEWRDLDAEERYSENRRKERDTYLRQADSQLGFMEKNRASMQELLDKGLKKV